MPADPRNAYLKRKYGITVDDYQRMLDAQGGVCAICGKPPKAEGVSLNVDHDHTTGMIRGLICWFDNSKGVDGRKTPEYLRRCIDYLESPPALAVIGHVQVPKKKRKRPLPR